MKVYFDNKQFSKAINSHLVYGDSLRKIGKKIGISAATLSRVKNGKPADINTILKICDWMNSKITHYIKDSKQFY
jgi:DNA-binding Xre family transcriptional regulator